MKKKREYTCWEEEEIERRYSFPQPDQAIALIFLIAIIGGIVAAIVDYFLKH